MSHKTCISCNISKPFEEYYKHSSMSFGVDSKCKECVKARAKLRHHNLTENDPDFVENERKRHREKYERLGYKNQQLDWDKDKPWKKTVIYKNLSRKLNLDKGFEAHHWNYNDEYLEDIFVLEARPHKKLHTYLSLDIEKRIFYLKDGTYLDSKEKHKNFIDSLQIKIHN